eukprot:2040622-Rhodomonas_salina.1
MPLDALDDQVPHGAFALHLGRQRFRDALHVNVRDGVDGERVVKFVFDRQLAERPGVSEPVAVIHFPERLARLS